jgi:hypothetical protein
MMLAGSVMPYEAAGYVIAIGAAAATAPLLWLIIREAAGPRVAWWGALLYAIHPTFVRMQSEVLANSLFILLFALSTLLLLKTLQLRSFVYPASLALTLAALYAVRPEALAWTAIVMAAIIGRAVILLRRKRPGEARHLIILALAGFGLLALCGLGFAGLGLMKGSARFVLSSVFGAASGAGPLDSTSLTYEAMMSLGPIPWFFAIIGAVVLRRNLASVTTVLCGISFFLVMTAGLMILTYTGRHYYLPAAALLLLPVAAGFDAMYVTLSRRRLWIANSLAVILLAAFILFAVKPVREMRVPYRQAGEWICATFGEGTQVFSERRQTGYYARGGSHPFFLEPDRMQSRPGDFLVTRIAAIDPDAYERIRERKRLEPLRSFPRSVIVYRIRR